MPLKGGITNTNFVVEDAGRKLVVRIGGDIEVHGISRKSELAASRAAHAAGVAPRSRLCRARRARSAPLSKGGRSDRRTSEIRVRCSRIVEVVHRCHQEIPKHLRGPGILFWVFHVVRDYAHTLAEASGVDMTQVSRLAGVRRATGAGGRAGGAGLRAQRPARRQLHRRRRAALAGRLGICAASTRRSSISAASHRTASSRLPQREALLEAYFGRPVTDELRYRYAAMTAASLLRETMWSMVSEVHSTIDFDYRAYTAENLARFEAALRRLRGDGARHDRAALLRQDRHRRRRHRRLLGRLSSRQNGHFRRASPGARKAHLRLDLACRGARRAAAHQRQHHPAAQLFGRPLRPAGGGDRARHRLEAERRAAPRLQRGALDGGEAPGDDRAQFRAGDAPPFAQGGAGALAADDGRRRGRRRLPADRRPGEPERHRAGARQGRAHAPA